MEISEDLKEQGLVECTETENGKLAQMEKETSNAAKSNSISCIDSSCIISLFGPGPTNTEDMLAIHIFYLVVLFTVIIFSYLMFQPAIASGLMSSHLCPNQTLSQDCLTILPYSLIYRSCFAVSFFFLLLFILVLPFSSFYNFRVRIHTGFWLPKLAFLAFALFWSYNIPRSALGLVWMYFGMGASFMYTFIQLVFLIDAAESWNQFLTDKAESTDLKFWNILRLISTGVVYTSSAVVVVLLYLYYSRQDSCEISSFILTANVLICLVAIVVSVRLEKLLQTSLATLYMIYLTYASLNFGRSECNSERNYAAQTGSEPDLNLYSIIGVTITFILLSYACLRKPQSGMRNFGQSALSRGNKSREEDNAPSLLYLVLLMFSFNAMMMITNWYNPMETNYGQETANWLALILKALASIITILLYTWSLIASILYPERDTHSVQGLLTSLCVFTSGSLYTLFIKPCPFCNQSKSTRFVYTFFFITGVGVSCVMYVPMVRRALETNQYFCSRLTRMGNCLSMDPAFLAVYRICFSMAAFFLLFAMILYSVQSYSDPRALIHNGVWLVKFGLFFGLVVFTFFIPMEFSKIWLYLGLAGTFFFIVIQLFLLVDFTRLWNKSWARKMEETGKKCWFYAVLVCTSILYVVSAAAIVCFYVFFGASKRCKTNKMFVSMNMVLCAVAAIISIHPKVHDGGLLQSSVITTYSVYLTWSALSYNPNEKCNPVATYISETDMRPGLNSQATLDLILLLITIIYFSVRISPLTDTLRKLIATTLRLVIGLRRRKVKDGEETDEELGLDQSDPMYSSCDDLRQFSDERVPYSYSFFHFVYFIAAIHVTMVLTNWYSPNDGSNIKLSIAWAAMCIKMTSSSMCILLYIWSLAVPILLYNRKPC